MVEAGVVPCIASPKDSLGNFIFPVSTTLGSEELEVLLPRGSALLTGDTARVPLNYLLWLFGCLIANDQQVKRGVIL